MINHVTGVSLTRAGPAGQKSLRDQTEETHAHPLACFACFAAAAAAGGAVDAAVDLGGSAEHGQSLLLPAWVTASAGLAACSQAPSSPWGEGVGWVCSVPGASEQQ